jgi:uncharacterized protein
MISLLTDTSALYALADRTDRHHAAAAACLARQAKSSRLLVSNHVFDETMTVVKARLGMQAALQLGLRLRASALVEWVVFTADLELETWRLFSHYVDKDWSYTDCACFALAHARGLSEAFTFDRHFTQMGLTPRP